MDVDWGANPVGGLSSALVFSISGFVGAFRAPGASALGCVGILVFSWGVPLSGEVEFSSSLGVNVMSFWSEGLLLPERLGSEGVVLPELL